MDRKKITKNFVQDCCMFIGASSVIWSIPFWLMGGYSNYGFVLLMFGFCLVCVTIIHKFIFGGKILNDR